MIINAFCGLEVVVYFIVDPLGASVAKTMSSTFGSSEDFRLTVAAWTQPQPHYRRDRQVCLGYL